ncbi:MAG: hypothetical protein HYY06_17105 [Deltaproteobacteria bacterium]|nr:hypothetical protein [Deltaproteobacteria bacterium]
MSGGAPPPAGNLGRPPRTISPPVTGDAPPPTGEIALPPPILEAPADAGEADAASEE